MERGNAAGSEEIVLEKYENEHAFPGKGVAIVFIKRDVEKRWGAIL